MPLATMHDLQKEMGALIHREEHLRTLIEKLNGHFQKTEDALNEFACATGSVQLPEATNDLDHSDNPVTAHLEFSRDGNRHRLLFTTAVHINAENSEEKTIPIQSATLKQRIEAAEWLPTLVRSLTTRTELIIDQIEKILVTV